MWRNRFKGIIQKVVSGFHTLFMEMSNSALVCPSHECCSVLLSALPRIKKMLKGFLCSNVRCVVFIDMAHFVVVLRVALKSYDTLQESA